MSYLYGDSTPSMLEVNFLDVLRDALDSCVQVLLTTERIRLDAERRGSLERATAIEVERLEKLGGAVTVAVQGVSVGGAEGPTARCASAIVNSASELVRTEIASMRQAQANELARLEAAATREREGCVRALETLLLRHDLPETTHVLELQVRGDAHYAARLRATTSFGLGAMLDLQVPPSHLFSHLVRVDRVMERLEIQVPDAGGRPHRDNKLRPQRLEKLHVAELTIGGAESVMKLRATLEGAGAGFDVLIRAQVPRVRVVRVGESQQVTEPPFEVSGADETRLLGLYEKLHGAAVELGRNRKALNQVSLDDRALRSHENPAVLVDRLVGAMAPLVQEIALRSRSETELILKRLLADDRREEIFVAKADLRKKLEALPPALRKVFDPLGLRDEDKPAVVQRPAGRAGPTQPGPNAVAGVPPNKPISPASLPPPRGPAPIAVEPHRAPLLPGDKTPAGGYSIVIDADEPSSAERSGEDPRSRRE